MSKSNPREGDNQAALASFLMREAWAARKRYAFPHLHPDEIKSAASSQQWHPRAGERGGNYTAIFAFADTDLRLVSHDALGALACYHINGGVNVTAFFMRFAMTPFTIKNGRMNRIIQSIESMTGAAYIDGKSPSPLFADYRDAVRCWPQKVKFTDFSDIIGCDLSRAPRRSGNWNGVAGGKAGGRDVSAAAASLKADIIEMLGAGASKSEGAEALSITVRTVNNHVRC